MRPKADSPQDAAWINASQTLLCRSPADVYLLLKASDFITHDIDHAFDDCVDEQGPDKPKLTLVLKKWFEMPRSQEFRCFVRDRRLFGACIRCTSSWNVSMTLAQPSHNATSTFMTFCEMCKRLSSIAFSPSFTISSCPRSPVRIVRRFVLHLELLTRTRHSHLRRLPHSRLRPRLPCRHQPFRTSHRCDTLHLARAA